MGITMPPTKGTFVSVAARPEMAATVSETAQTAATNLPEVTFSKYIVKSFTSYFFIFAGAPDHALHSQAAKTGSGPVTNQKGKQWQLIQAATKRSVEERRQAGFARPRRRRGHSNTAYPRTILGGGTGGAWFSESALSSSPLAFQKCVGALKTKTVAEYENSNFLPASRKLGLLLRLLPLGDCFAQSAGVLAVESLGQRLANSPVLRVVDHHPHPGHRLQKAPVQANRTGQRRDNR